MLYYCDMYLQKKGCIAVSELLPLLFVSSIITMKFWSEEHVEDMNLAVSKLSGIPLSELLRMEVEMLKTIDYNLYIDEKKIKEFKETMKSKYTTSNIKVKYALKTNVRLNERGTGTGADGGRKRMRLMDDMDYYQYYHQLV